MLAFAKNVGGGVPCECILCAEFISESDIAIKHMQLFEPSARRCGLLVITPIIEIATVLIRNTRFDVDTFSTSKI